MSHSFLGFTQGSVHQATPPKLTKGADWQIQPVDFNKGLPRGLNVNFPVKVLGSARTKQLTDHSYTPLIGDCATVSKGDDWALPTTAYETYRLKGATNDQGYKMPEFLPNSKKGSVLKSQKHTQNVALQSVDAIPKAFANFAAKQTKAQWESVMDEYHQELKNYKARGSAGPKPVPPAPGPRFDRFFAERSAWSKSGGLGIKPRYPTALPPTPGPGGPPAPGPGGPPPGGGPPSSSDDDSDYSTGDEGSETDDSETDSGDEDDNVEEEKNDGEQTSNGEADLAEIGVSMPAMSVWTASDPDWEPRSVRAVEADHEERKVDVAYMQHSADPAPVPRRHAPGDDGRARQADLFAQLDAQEQADLEAEFRSQTPSLISSALGVAGSTALSVTGAVGSASLSALRRSASYLTTPNASDTWDQYAQSAAFPTQPQYNQVQAFNNPGSSIVVTPPPRGASTRVSRMMAGLADHNTPGNSEVEVGKNQHTYRGYGAGGGGRDRVIVATPYYY